MYLNTAWEHTFHKKNFKNTKIQISDPHISSKNYKNETKIEGFLYNLGNQGKVCLLK